MKTLILLLTGLFFTLISYSQSLKKNLIGNSGCYLYTYCEPKYEVAYSDDSSKVFTGECKNGEVTYGVICVKLLNAVEDLTEAENLLVSYLDYLKKSFDIQKSAGYGKGHRLNNNESTRGIIDYWEDKDNEKWKVKAWTDGHFIGVMYAFSSKELPETKVNVFLDSFRFAVAQ